MSEFAAQHIEKLHVPPLVQDSTLPSAASDDDAGTKTGVLVAVVGDPIDGGVPVYDATLGYCVWQAAGGGPDATYAWMWMTTIDETGATVLLTDSDGSPIATFVPVT